MQDLTQHEKNLLILASPEQHVLAHWSSSLNFCVSEKIDKPEALEQRIQSSSAPQPSLVLCDERLVRTDPEGVFTFSGNIKTSIPILIMTSGDPEKLNLDWLPYGVRGCCPQMLDAEMLCKAVSTILSGETWFPRRLIARIISNINSEPELGTDDTMSKELTRRLTTLTNRELEVAKLVTQGLNNKLIARQLDVTERTVKAHLGKVFQKLEIENRLVLALNLKNHFGDA